MKTEWAYVSVSNNDTRANFDSQVKLLFKCLDEGYEIISCAGNGLAVHYLLKKVSKK
jgi:hypothetical protein